MPRIQKAIRADFSCNPAFLAIRVKRLVHIRPGGQVQGLEPVLLQSQRQPTGPEPEQLRQQGQYEGQTHELEERIEKIHLKYFIHQ